MVEIVYWIYIVLSSIVFFVSFTKENNFFKVLLGFLFGGALIIVIPVLPIFLFRLIPEEYAVLENIISLTYLSFLIFFCAYYLYKEYVKQQKKTNLSSSRKVENIDLIENSNISNKLSSSNMSELQELNDNLSSDNKVLKNPDNKVKKYDRMPRYEDMDENEQMRYRALQRALKTFKENYEQSNTEKIIITNSLLFTNYSSNYQKTNSYPIVRVPKLGTIIRSYQIGRAQKRGFKEEVFQKSLEKYFGTEFTILGNARINTGNQTRPYEPDIAMIDTTNSNLRIDIEIDEPYAGITRQPTHCENEDIIRDLYFTDRGWLVIRFSEYQVHTQELECLRFIADVIKLVNPKYLIPESLKNTLKIKDEKFWDILQAQKWEKVKYREKYLNHIFQFISEKSEKFISDLTNHEQTEESLVKSTYIGNVDRSLATGFNLKNKHLRDEIIKFYPESHNYTISNVQAISVSTIISKFFPEFDSYVAASKLNPSHKLYNFTIDEILDIWKKQGEESARKGTLLHKQIENYYLGKKFEETPELHLFKDFIKENNILEPYRTEWRIFDEQYNIAGTIDLIAKNGAHLEIYDWKRSRKIVNAYTGELIREGKWQKGIGQLSEIEDTSYNRYCLQQSLYKYILEKNYDLKISNMYLIVLHPDYDTYYKVKVPYLKSEIEYILKSM